MKTSDLSAKHKKIKKITTVYDQLEDRLRLDASLVDGSFVSLLLTRSILNRLIPHLQNGATGTKAHSGESSGETLGTDDESQRADQFVQMVVQKAAVECLPKNNPPVKVEPTTTRHLIRSINLKKGNGQVVLEFISAPPIELGFDLVLSFVETRQWLSILKGRYVVGAWVESFWADWV